MHLISPQTNHITPPPPILSNLPRPKHNSCDSCRNSRKRCDFDREQGSCDRCHRMNRKCAFTLPDRRTHAGKWKQKLQIDAAGLVGALVAPTTKRISSRATATVTRVLDKSEYILPRSSEPCIPPSAIAPDSFSSCDRYPTWSSEMYSPTQTGCHQQLSHLVPSSTIPHYSSNYKDYKPTYLLPVLPSVAEMIRGVPRKVPNERDSDNSPKHDEYPAKSRHFRHF
ncbi:hypothetical protein BDR26DRAFT_870436 [Obelidium mucronatum]|nr:hypothetical protein BDR26DRAFT_870436 [Obelidium mucronatum]